MSLRPDGTYRCDRCDTDIGNAGIDTSAHTVMFNPNQPGDIWHLHFCLPSTDPFNPREGCRDAVFTPDVLTHHPRS